MSFISDYLLFTSGNESPPVFHKWGCLATLAALAGRRFWFNHGPFTYYPNFYTLFVGEAGVKKSSAMDRAKDVIRAVGGIPIAATSTSKEAVTKMMGDEKYAGKKTFIHGPDSLTPGLAQDFNQLAICATEFTSFLGLIAPDSMVDFLTTIYTETIYDEKFKNSGNSFFVGPFITLIGCMTPSTMKGMLKHSIIQGGFARRTMFVWGTRAAPVAWPEFTSDQREAFNRCVLWGKEIAKHNGPMAFADEDKPFFKHWYDDNFTKVTDRKPNTQGYYLTKHEFMLKTAMLMTLSEEGPTARRIRPETIEFLDKVFFLPVEENLERVFEGAGINPNSEGVARVVRMLEGIDKPFSKKKLEAMFMDNFTSINELRDSLTHLVGVGRLVEKVINLEIEGRVQFLGTCIGTPEAMEKATNEEMGTILMRKGL